MSYPIIKIEGIGAKYAKKLTSIGVTSTAKLLDRAKDRKGRRQLAEESGIDEQLILKWANMSDLVRIKGIGEEYSELLEKAGVDTVKELRNRKPESLHVKLTEANAGKKKLVRVLPSLNKVKSWVEQAKALPPVMTY